MTPYLTDILSQPAVLRNALEHFPRPALENIRLADFDRVIISGMGSSYQAAYPALVELSGQSVPVQLINTAELLHSLRGLIGPRTLLWLNSQSGRSAEPVSLLEKIEKEPPARLLTVVNDVTSPLGEKADICLPIRAGEEATVSTKTFMNMLAVNLLAAIQLRGGMLDQAYREIEAAIAGMEAYLTNWQAHVQRLDAALGEFDRLVILGRGTSLSAVWNGSLINKEAARSAFEGMHAADFRHGPLEIVSEGFTALIFAGPGTTSALNRELAHEIISHGGKAIWLDSKEDPGLPSIVFPETSELARPLVEILPMQMLTLAMARRKNIEAGAFRYVSKITDRE